MRKVLASIVLVLSAVAPVNAGDFSGEFGCTLYTHTNAGCRPAERFGLDFGLGKTWHIGLGLRKEGKFIADGYFFDLKVGKTWMNQGKFSLRSSLGVEFGIPTDAYGSFQFMTDGNGKVTSQSWQSIEQNGKLPFLKEYSDFNTATVTHPFVGLGLRYRLNRRFFSEIGARVSFGKGLTQEARYDPDVKSLIIIRDGQSIIILPRLNLGFGISF